MPLLACALGLKASATIGYLVSGRLQSAKDVQGREWFGNFEGGIIYENSDIEKIEIFSGLISQTRRHNILKFQYGYIYNEKS